MFFSDVQTSLRTNKAALICPFTHLTKMGILCYAAYMSTAKKLKNLEIDARGRITLPKELRDGVDTFSVEPEKDGTLKLIPQKHMSLEDAKLIESLKKSAKEIKKGKLHKMPTDWSE